jgi:toxin FitB
VTYVIDSSGWIEFFAGGKKGNQHARYILSKKTLLLPSLVIFEVYKKIKKSIGEHKAIWAVTQMDKAACIPLDQELALYAADLSLQHKLAMADSIVYATARRHKAQLVTSDNDFRDLEDVILI